MKRFNKFNNPDYLPAEERRKAIGVGFFPTTAASSQGNSTPENSASLVLQEAGEVSHSIVASTSTQNIITTQNLISKNHPQTDVANTSSDTSSLSISNNQPTVTAPIMSIRARHPRAKANFSDSTTHVVNVETTDIETMESSSSFMDTSDGFSKPKKFFAPRHQAAALSTITTANRFQELTPTEIAAYSEEEKDAPEMSVQKETTSPLQQKPTNPKTSNFRGNLGSFFIENVSDNRALINELKSVCKSKISAQNTKDFLVIKPNSLEDHKAINKKLQEIKLLDKDASFYSHRATEERRTRLVIKGLSPNIQPTEIIEDIECLGIKVFHLSELVKKEGPNTFKHLAIYVMEIAKAQAGDARQKIRYLCDHKISLEEYKSSDRVPHCTRCQMWGHTKNYCSRPITCPVCAGPHSLDDCKKPSTPTCANCQREHVASFGGCPALLALKKEREQIMLRAKEAKEAAGHKRMANNFASNQTSSAPRLSSFTSPGKSYTQALTGISQPTTSINPLPNTIPQENPIATFLKNLDIPKILTTIAQVTEIFNSTEPLLNKIMSTITIISQLF